MSTEILDALTDGDRPAVIVVERPQSVSLQLGGLVRYAVDLVKRSVQVEIAGQQLSIRSDEGPEYVQELADYVDAHVRALAGDKRSSFSLQRVALLVAMEIADELFREKDLSERYRRRVENKLAALRAAIDEHESRLQAL